MPKYVGQHNTPLGLQYNINVDFNDEPMFNLKNKPDWTDRKKTTHIMSLKDTIIEDMEPWFGLEAFCVVRKILMSSLEEI